MGLQPGSLEAYCFDQAVWYGGSTIRGLIDAVPQKKGANAAKLREHEQQMLLEKLLGVETSKKKGQFRDPAMMFRGGENNA